jgi:steroid 5-alpha reductase family enzyme
MKDLPLIVLLLSISFTLLWLWQRYTRNASWADAGWALSVGLVMIWWLQSGEGDTTRRWLAGAVASLWSVRLGLHLLNRARNSTEDGRFQDLRHSWGHRAQRNFLRYFLLQVPLVLLFALPAAAIAQDVRTPGLRDLLGVVVALVGLAGVSIADRQLHTHRRTATSVCRQGLWQYSRHPNYFFEWIFWCAWPFMAPLSPRGLLAWVTPVAAYVLLTRVTGIPPAERRSLARGGDEYRRYQEMTSAFFPRSPKTHPQRTP